MSEKTQSSPAHRRELIFALAATLILTVFLAAPSLIKYLPTRTSKTFTSSNVFQGAPIQLGDFPSLCEATKQGRSLVVRITGRLDDLRNYQNLFQTADLNAGIRLEVDASGSVGLLVADGSELTFLVVPAAGTLVPGRFKILIVIADGKSVELRLGKSIAKGLSRTLNPSCSNVVIGLGYDSSRTTAGRYRIEFSAFEERRQFVPDGFDRTINNEFVRTVALGVLVFSLILIALNLADRFAKPPISEVNEDNGEDRSESDA